MERSVYFLCPVAENLRNVDLAAFWPLSVEILFRGHHPERREESLAGRKFYARLNPSVFEVMLAFCVDSAGSVRSFSAPRFFLNGLNHEISVLYVDVLL